MKPDNFYVWSSGLETWKEANLSYDDGEALQFSHVKTFGTGTLRIYKDPLNRFIGIFVPDWY